MNRFLVVTFVIVLIFSGVVLAASCGKYQVYEEVSIPYTTFRSTAITWYPLSKAYSTSGLLIGIQPVNIVFNSTATEKKFVIEIAGGDTSAHLDLAFYDTGIIDIVETTSTGATKLADTSASGIKWQDIQFVIVEIESQNVTLRTDNGTVLVSVTWSSVPSTIEQVGGSAGVNSLTNGTVYVAILYDPYSGIIESTSDLMYSFIPLIFTIVAIAIPLMFMKIIIKWLNKIF